MKVIGLDQHKYFSQVAVMDEKGAIIKEHKLSHKDKESISQYLSPFKGDSKVAMESTGNWTWMCDLLEKEGFEVHLSHPLKTRLICEAKVKTDKVDARMLAHLLRADLLPESYIAPLEVRQERQKLRYRLSLVKMRTALKNRIHGLLEQLGVTVPPVTDLFGKEGIAWLRTVHLDGSYLMSLEGYLRLIDELNLLIHEMDVEIKRSLKDNQSASLLDTIPGIGILTSHLLIAEIGPIDRFPSAKKLCSYAGLVPSVHQSGQTSYNGRITKQGSRYIRWAMIEAAQKAYLKDASLSKFYHKLCAKKGRSKAIVALARKMLVIAYNVLKYNEPYNLSGKSVERAGRHNS